MSTMDEISKWEADGKAIAERLEAERDALVASIERERLQVQDINYTLRRVRERLGIQTQPEPEVPAPNRRVYMRREEQKQVPVEARNHNGASLGGPKPTTFSAALYATVCQGHGTTSEITNRALTIAPTLNPKSVTSLLRRLEKLGKVERRNHLPHMPGVWYAIQ